MQIIILLLTLLLTACQSNQDIKGNYSNLEEKHLDNMAKDSLIEINKFYLPSRIGFIIKQNNTDFFGNRLIELLKKNGFKMSENNNLITSHLAYRQVPLVYLIDHLDFSSNSYIITIYIENTIFSRAYQIENMQLKALTAWSKGN